MSTTVSWVRRADSHNCATRGSVVSPKRALESNPLIARLPGTLYCQSSKTVISISSGAQHLWFDTDLAVKVGAYTSRLKVSVPEAHGGRGGDG